MGTIPEGTAEDVDKAVRAAGAAFDTWSTTSIEDRAKYLQGIPKASRLAPTRSQTSISQENGMPLILSKIVQAGLPAMNFAILRHGPRGLPVHGEDRDLRDREGAGRRRRAITPWNYPLHQVALKLAAAFAAGCTVVLKPSEVAPNSAWILAEVIDDVGLPAGVFNLVSGSGPVVGEALTAHPEIDMISFTGSTRAGKRISEVASQTVKRVALELGGKSPNVILPDADLNAAVPAGVRVRT